MFFLIFDVIGNDVKNCDAEFSFGSPVAIGLLAYIHF